MSKKVKVAHLISGLQRGGAETVLYQLVSSLDKRTFEQTVIYFHKGPYLETFKELGVPLYHVNGLLFQYDPVFIYRLFVVLKHVRPDCLHTVLWAAGFWGRIVGHFLKIPVIHACHNMVSHNGIVRNLLDRLFARWVGATVAVSEGVSASIVKQAPWMKKYDLSVIKNGIDTGSVLRWAKQAVSKEQLGIGPKDLVIGAVGRLEYEKNFGLLLTSFALLYDEYPNTVLIIVGSGRQERFLRMRAFDLGIEDRVLFITDQQAYPYYPLFDCFVMTSLTEGLSMALLEAMTFQLSCIVTSATQLHEVIKSGTNGLIVSNNDPDQLARAIGRCLKSKALRQKLGEAAFQTVSDHFTAQEMVKEYGNLYKKIVGQSDVSL